MNSGDGGNPIDNLAKHPLGALADAAVQISTGGIAGIDPTNGKFNWRGGAVGHAVDEGLGEITGRNLAREQAGQAQHAAELEAAARAQDLKDRQNQQMQEDINASSQIAAIRGTAGGGRSPSALRFQTLGNSDTRDFLGL